VRSDQHTAPNPKSTTLTLLQHSEHNFSQKDDLLHQSSKAAIAHNLNNPTREATSLTNQLVQSFYERDNIQLLDTSDHEWEATKLDYLEFYGRVASHPQHFHEYFPRLIEAVREYARRGLGRGLAVIKPSMEWPDSRVAEERELFERVWGFERRRWNRYARFGAGVEMV
jgi:hypothetical protein